MIEKKPSLRWRIWYWLFNKGHSRLAYYWYAVMVSPFNRYNCKLCNRRRMRLTGVVAHLHKEDVTGLEGWRSGVLCRQCHKEHCGRRHGRGLVFCTVDLNERLK